MKFIPLFFSLSITVITPHVFFAQNNGASFNGDNSYYSITPTPSVNFSNNFTIEAWVNTTTKIGTLAVINKVNCGAASTSYSLSIVDGHVQWAFNAGGNCNSTSYGKTDEDLVNPGECTHIAITHSEDGIEFYVNGQWVSYTLIAGSLSDVYISSEPIRIGAYKNLSGNFVLPFLGTIDEVRIWDIVKTPEQIALNYNAEFTSPQPHLIINYNFNPATVNGDVVSNQANAGTSLNAAYVSTTSPVFATSCVTFDAGVSELANASTLAFTVYPNPVQDLVKISTTNFTTISEITIHDLSGNKIMSLNPESPVTEINVSPLESGYYLVSITDIDRNRATQKIMKE